MQTAPRFTRLGQATEEKYFHSFYEHGSKNQFKKISFQIHCVGFSTLIGIREVRVICHLKVILIAFQIRYVFRTKLWVNRRVLSQL